MSQQRRALGWLLGVLAVAVFGAAPQAAFASGLRLLVRGIDAFASDGARYVVWEVSGQRAIFVLDTRTGQTIGIKAPCPLIDKAPAAAGRFLLECALEVRALLDVRTGKTTILPKPPPPAPYAIYGPRWNGVGRRSVVGDAGLHARCHRPRRHEGCVALYDIATGAMTEVPEWRVPDVDRVGAPPLCSALRSKVRQLSRAEDEEGFGPLAPLGSEFSYGDGLLAAPEGLGTEEGIPNFVRHLIVTPCHGPAILVPAHSERRNLVQGWHLELSGAILTWDTGHKSLLSDIEEEFGPGEGNLRHGTLASFNVHTHKRRTWPLPILTLRVTIDDRKPISRSTVGTFGYSAHTDHEVFWIAARSFSCPPGFSEEHCGGLTNNEVSSIYAVQV